MSQRVLRSDGGGLCTLLLNRPDKLNALDTTTFEELDAHLEALERNDGTVGCVVLRGAGRAFCAGADLNALANHASPPLPAAFKPRVVERLSQLRQPVIAAVHGVCFTGGLELALACDVLAPAGSLDEVVQRFADELLSTPKRSRIDFV